MTDPREQHTAFCPVNNSQTIAVRNHQYQAISILLTVHDGIHGQTLSLCLNTQLLLLFIAQRRDKSDEPNTKIDLLLNLQV